MQLFRQQLELEELQKRHREEIEAFCQQVSATSTISAPVESNGGQNVTPIDGS